MGNSMHVCTCVSLYPINCVCTCVCTVPVYCYELFLEMIMHTPYIRIYINILQCNLLSNHLGKYILLVSKYT